MKRRIGLGLLALVAALSVPAIMGRGALLGRLADIPISIFIIGVLLAITAWIFTAARLLILVRNSGFPLSPISAFGVAMATEFAVIATPGGTGGPVAQALLLQQRQIPASSAVALYTFDHMVDATFFLVLIPILALALSADLTEQLGHGLLLIGGLLAVCLVAVVVAFKNYRALLLRTGPLLDRLRLSKRRRHRIAKAVLRFRQALRTAGKMPASQLFLLILCCTCQWLSRYSVLLIIVKVGLGVALSAGYLFTTQIIGLGIGQATMLPGGGGGADLSISALLVPFSDAATVAAALLAWRMTTTYLQLFCGSAVFATMLHLGRKRT